MGLVYNNEVPGLGEVIQSATPITVIKGLLLTPPNFEFATKQAFATQSNYLTAIAAGTMFPIQGIIEDEVADFADKVLETTTGSKVFQFSGKRGRILKLSLSLEQHKVLYSNYSLKKWNAFLIDENNNILGTTPDGTKVKGLKLSYFRVPMQGPGKDGSLTSIELQFANVSEYDSRGIMVNPTFEASDLIGVLNVVQTVSAVAANSVTISVNYVDNSQLTSAGAADSVAVSGLLAANFQIMNGSTEVTAGKTVTESAALPGTYTVSATTLVAGYTVKVIATSANLYKSDASTLAA